MPLVRFEDWTEFVSELEAHAPTHRTVNLTLSVRYATAGDHPLSLVAWCETRKNWVVHADDLHPALGEDRDRFATRVDSLVRARKDQLEHEGFVVSPGRLRVNTFRADGSPE